MTITLDQLGENVSCQVEVDAAVSTYTAMLRRSTPRTCGQRLRQADDARLRLGDAVAHDAMTSILDVAREVGGFGASTWRLGLHRADDAGLLRPP